MLTALIVSGTLILIFFSMMFSAAETAFFSINKLRLRFLRDKKHKGALKAGKLLDNKERLLNTVLVGNNIVNIGLSVLFTSLALTLFGSRGQSLGVALASVSATVLLLIFGEILPKTAAAARPERVAFTLAGPITFFSYVFNPLVRFFTLLCSRLIALFGIKVASSTVSFTEEEIKTFIEVGGEEGLIHSAGEKMMRNVFTFTDLEAQDIMVPRTEINAVEENCSLMELQQMFIESGNSKIIVYQDDIDHVKGYIHSSEMFRAPERWREHIRKMPFVPETMPAQKLMQVFLQQKKSLGVVVDEFGGTSGIVSLEDIVEEIFGDIEDEHDNTKYVAKQIADNEYVLSARLEIDKVNEMFNLDLPESDDYMTVGGLLLHVYQSFPKVNEIITVGQYEFRIIKNTMTKIELVRLKDNGTD